MADEHPTRPVTTDTGPFAIVPLWLVDALIEAPSATGSALTVYVVLHQWADYDTGECWPSQKTIAERCAMSQSTAKEALRTLRDVGAVTVTQTTTPDGGPGPNHYCIRHSRPTSGESAPDPSGESPHPPSGDRSATNKSQSERDPSEPPLGVRNASAGLEVVRADVPLPGRTREVVAARAEVARDIATEWYEAARERTGSPPTAPRFPAVMKLADNAVRVHRPTAVLAALNRLYAEGRPITGQTLDGLLTNREHGRRPTGRSAQRNPFLQLIDDGKV